MAQLEVRFGIIEKQAIHRGTFASVKDLTTKIRAFHQRLERGVVDVGQESLAAHRMSDAPVLKVDGTFLEQTLRRDNPAV